MDVVRVGWGLAMLGVTERAVRIMGSEIFIVLALL
jgi:hypothetical protein